MTTTTVRVITSVTEMVDHAALWNLILGSARCDVPFLSWEWLTAQIADFRKTSSSGSSKFETPVISSLSPPSVWRTSPSAVCDLHYISAVKRLPLKRVNVLDTLLALCMEESIERGCVEFDMLRGGEEYKRRWTPLARRVVTVRFYSGTSRSTAFRWARSARGFFRHVTRRASSPA